MGSGLSTVDSIENLVSHVLFSFENRYDTSAVVCDLSKAFYCVDGAILLKTLKHYGIILFVHSLFTSTSAIGLKTFPQKALTQITLRYPLVYHR
ncbi:hypothetical protein J6590_099068, partial [Homalodisca vitripennis]